VVDPDNPDAAVPLADVMDQLDLQVLRGAGHRGPNPDDISLRSFGIHCADVEVDTGLGTVRVTGYFALHDSGLIVNPLTARTNVEGAVIEGIGQTLYREVPEDPRRGRQPAGYPLRGLAAAPGSPTIDFAFTIDIDPDANTVAAKGLNGASSLPVSAAIANAVLDAVGVPVTALPLTPDRLLTALEEAGA
jgi:xanthine dehydrogenase YagR molybdenum-binding subunit